MSLGYQHLARQDVSSTTPPPSSSTEISSTTPPFVTPTPSTTSSPPVVTPSSTPDAPSFTPVSPTSTSTNGYVTPSNTFISSTSTYVFSTVVVTTDPNGQVQTQTVRSTQLVFPSSTSGGGGGGSSSNTAAIAGGVVGGAVGILALIMIVFFLLRRHKRKDEFDGNFDPDRLDPERLGGNATRPGTMPHVDLVGAEVTPYQYSSDAAPQKGYQQYPQMAQQQRPGTAPVMGGAGYATSDARSSTTGSHYPTTITDPSGMRPDFRGPSPGVSLGTSGTLPSSKGRESTSEGGVLRVANDENGEGGSGGGIMFQHRDAGRIPEEVPPSYDSISPDERSAAGTSQGKN